MKKRKNQNTCISPYDLRNKIIKECNKYNNKNQPDSAEFISDFRDIISKKLNRSRSTYYDTYKCIETLSKSVLEYGKKLNKINSIVEDLFYG